MKTYHSFNEIEAAIGKATLVDNMSPQIPHTIIPLKEQGGFQFSFYSNEPDRKNIHARKSGELVAVFWTEPNVEIKRPNKNAREQEINEASRIIADNQEKINDFIDKFNEGKKPRNVKTNGE